MTEKVLTIQRSKWRRGGDSESLVGELGPTQLLNEQGLMCCLGFDALARGIPANAIDDLLDPCDISVEFWPDGYAETHLNPAIDRMNSDAVGRAIHANDNSRISDEERETRVRSALLELGWDDVIFVD